MMSVIEEINQEKEMKFMYKLLKQEGKAKRARLETVHGII